MVNHTFVIVMTISAVYSVNAYHDYYSSISGLEILLEAEKYLLDNLRNVMELEEKSEDNEFLKTLEDIKEQNDQAQNDTLSYLTSPISAFKLIKRFVVDWTLVEEYITNENFEDLVTILSGFMDGNFESPTKEDLQGAVLGLVRLQKTYSLNESDLADGKILGVKYSTEMSASDCLEIGISSYHDKHYKISLNWFHKALEKLNRTSSIPEGSTTDTLLRYISTVYYSFDKPMMGFHINREVCAIDPTYMDDLEIRETYEVKTQEQTNENLYEMTCRGERHQNSTEQRPLRCMYMTNEKPFRIIAPFKVEQLNLDPLILYYYDVITDRDIIKIIETAKSTITRSETGGVNSIRSQYRTSKQTWLSYYDHEFLDGMSIVLTDLTGLTLSTAEELQVVNYGIGGHYGVHWDFSEDPNDDFKAPVGNRIATALFYLNDVELGGSTAFPFLKMAARPAKGSMILWYNLHESLEPDYRTAHAGCPVLKGSKWIVTEWYHERGQEFLRPCSLEQQGAVSEALKHKAYDLS